MGQNYKLDIMVKQIKPFELNQTANGVLKFGWGIHRDTPGGARPSLPSLTHLVRHVSSLINY